MWGQKRGEDKVEMGEHQIRGSLVQKRLRAVKEVV
jgi:hypothetical protein